MDTTSSVDNTNCSVTLLLCKGPLGAAVPLGIIISSGQDEVDYLAGLRILKELWGPAAFGGKGYPNSFMTAMQKEMPCGCFGLNQIVFFVFSIFYK